MRDYKKLEVWLKSHDMYMFIKKQIAPKFPREERHEMTANLLRAALSVPLNIVAGCGRFSDKDFAHFLDNALASVNETDYCCFAASELEYITTEEYNMLHIQVLEVRNMLIAFLKYLRPED